MLRPAARLEQLRAVDRGDAEERVDILLLKALDYVFGNMGRHAASA
jgi:hypothetical protein